MPKSKAGGDGGKVGPQPDQKRRARPERTGESGVPASPEVMVQVSDAWLGSDFSQGAFERHAALLGDPRMSSPMYARQRAAIAQRLQRDYGNRYVQRLVNHISRQRAEVAQTKLTVGPAGDKYEREADQVAKEVMRTISSPGPQPVQTRDADEPKLQLQPQGQPPVPVEGGDAGQATENAIQKATGHGQALPESVRHSMEAAFGAGFGGVRVHADGESDALNDALQARAFTSGRDIFFKQGQYSPASQAGQELLAHELTHVVQQTGNSLQRAQPQKPGQEPQADTTLDPEQGIGDELETASGRISGPEANKENKNGMPDDLKAGVERLSGISMDDVQVRYNSSKPSEIQALAYTKGTEIHLGPGQERHLPHEAWHVVQQAQGRVRSTPQTKRAPINDDQGLEREADVMGEKASRVGGESLRRKPARYTISVARGPGSVIQRTTYAELGDPQAKAKVDQWSDEAYADATREFEFKMSPTIMNDTRVNAIVDGLLGRVHRIVKAWAESTGRDLSEAYVREFSWAPGDQYYGAFAMTSYSIQQAFEDPNQPMRTKLKVVYNAVRNNNLSKWLKVAAIELDRKLKGQTAKAQKIKTATEPITERGPQGGRRIIRGRAEKETVQTGFAEKSGLQSWMTGPQVEEFAQIAGEEKKTEHGRSERDVFAPGSFFASDVVGWKPETFKAHGERRSGASGGLGLEEQSTLSQSDVPDLTDEEIDLLFYKQHGDWPAPFERERFRSDPNAKILWGQGGEYYDIDIHSDSAKAAQSVKARMEAGISGSTDLMIHAAKNLGLGASEPTMKGLRLALAGWMMANRDHSFYEIYKAAESYGIPFEIDPKDPGKEYESDINLYPMNKADFANTLPSGKFPRYFLSKDYKDHLADNLGAYAQDQDTYKGWLRAYGVPESMLSNLDERATAELERLAEVVEHQPIADTDSPDKKTQATRRIQAHSSYIYLATQLPMGEAEAMLTALIKSQHGGKGVALGINDKYKALIGAGIPRDILSSIPRKEMAKEIDNLEDVRQAVVSAQVSPRTGKLKMTRSIYEALKKLNMIKLRRDMVRDILIITYHGKAALPYPSAQDQADQSRKLAIIENIARMKRTSGWWYSWGNLGYLQGAAKASSIRKYTVGMSFEQGPGFYVANTAHSSATYGDKPGQGIIAVRLSGVPTIDRGDKAQMKALAQFGSGGDPLKSAGLYQSRNVVGMLMRYGSGNYARLTTNEGVKEMTLDMTRPPEAELKKSYNRMNDGAKANFESQAGGMVAKWAPAAPIGGGLPPPPPIGGGPLVPPPPPPPI